jgi:uncharacterized phage protein gp47/JayE
MPSVVLKRYEQILQNAINIVVARSPLSDLTDASSVKHVLAAFSRELDEAYYQLGLIPERWSLDTAVGDDLDARAEEVQPAVITRFQAAKATGQVVFSRAGTSGIVSIPSGTSVKTSSGISYVTTAAGTIPNLSTTSGNVPAIAVLEGADGNVAPSTIIKFGAKPTGVDTVTNPGSFSNGADKETDDAFRARIKAFIRSLSRSTPQALEFIAGQVKLTTGQRVVFAHVFEDPINRGEVTLYIDDGAGTAESVVVITGENVTEGLSGPGGDSAVGGEEFLTLNNKPVKIAAPYTLTSPANAPYFAGRSLVQDVDFILDDATGSIYFTPPLSSGEQIFADYTAFTGLIEEVQKVVDGDPADRVNYPGWRAAGVRVHVATPQILQQVVEASIVMLEGYSQTSVSAALSATLSDYINSLGISGDVIRNEVIDRIMSTPGVYNCALLQPAADVIILDDQLPRITSGNILLSF